MSAACAGAVWVGGRQDDPHSPSMGGGSPSSCSIFGVDVGGDGAAADPRLAELRHMGIGRAWLNVAQEIGFDAFLTVWRVLATDDSVRDERNRVYVPLFNTFMRYQRNQYIRTLADAGLTPDEISDRLSRAGCEPLTPKHIGKLLSRA